MLLNRKNKQNCYQITQNMSTSTNLPTCIIFSLIFSACTVEPLILITTESAKKDAEKLLNELKIEYKGLHCSQPYNKARQFLTENRPQDHKFVDCDVSSKNNVFKISCQLNDCKLVEDKSLRLKIGIDRPIR